MTKIRHGMATLPPLLDTNISGHDERGELLIRGYTLSDLYKTVTFPEIMYLLFYKELPSSNQLQVFSDALVEQASKTPKIASSVFSIFQGDEHPLDMLTSCFAAMASEMDDPTAKTKQYLTDMAVFTMSQYWRLLSEHIAKRAKQTTMPCDEKKLDSDFSKDFMQQCFGSHNSAEKAYYLNILLSIASEYSFPPSTLVARCTASVRSSFLSACIAAMQSWHGYRHGSASEYAYNDLMAIGEQGGDVEKYYEQRRKSRLPTCGFGHRLYKKTKDPRAIYLESLSKEAYEKFGGRLYPIAKAAVEYFENRERKLYANPDLYLAVLFDSLGFVAKEVCSVALMGRMAGICAHIIEENSPMRPMLSGMALYTGSPLKPIPAIEER